MDVPWIGLAYVASVLYVLVKGAVHAWRIRAVARLVLGSIAYGVGVVGMLVFLTGRGSATVAGVWRLCFPLVILGSLHAAVAEFKDMWSERDPRVTAGEHRVLTILASVFSSALQVPYIWMNWRLL